MFKIIRIIFSPLYFLVLLLGGIVIPIWIFAFILGGCTFLGKFIFFGEYDKETLIMAFSFIIIPINVSKNFIKGNLQDI